jgi:uncharacterized protein (DUF427 family)
MHRMSLRVRESLLSGLGEVRHEPLAKRIRAELDGATVVDTTDAVLVWEPRRVVPSYAVPAGDVHARLAPAGPTAVAGDDVGKPLPEVSRRPVLDPSIPFRIHSTEGEALDVRGDDRTLPAAAFRLADPDLAGYVVLDFTAFDTWYEEDEVTVSHPRDPFHRIDVLASSRHVRLELDGTLIAESTRPVLLFETTLPTRYYLPRADVRAQLVPSATRTRCAYKGEASYFSVTLDGRTVPDLAWTYPAPLHEAGHVQDLVAFFDERIDVVLDGEPCNRPITPWS